jgi:hypothetical protein
MTGLGVHPGMYSQIRSYAELVDTVLRDLRHGQVEDSSGRRARLGSLLAMVGDKDEVSADAKLLEWMIRESGGPTTARLREMGRELNAGASTEQLCSDLETLAQTLEHERSTAFAKMQGR